MNKIKKVFNENKVLLVLGVILIICLIIIAIVALKSFYNGSDNVYGNRLDITETVPLPESTLASVKSTLENDEKVSKTDVIKKGKIVYITVTFVNDTKLDDAKKVAEGVIELFSEDVLSVYDLEFIIKGEGKEVFTLTGARNSNGSGTLVWSNNTVVKKADEGSNE